MATVTNSRKLMDKIYDNAQSKHVAAIKVYAADSKAYMDPDKTNQFGATALAEAFEHGCVIVDAGVEAIPVAMSALASGVRTLYYYKVADSGGTITMTASKVASGADPAN